MKKLIRKISLFVAIAMFATVLPSRIFAETKGNEANKGNTPAVTKEPKKEPKIIGEVESKREQYVKQFLMDDMTYQVAIYPEPVHYLVNGKWENIDNSMIEQEEAEDSNIEEAEVIINTSETKESSVTSQEEKKTTNKSSIFTNKKNDFNINISKKSDSKKLVNIKKDKYEINWNLENSNKVEGQIVSIDTDNIEKNIEALVDNELSKQTETTNKDEKRKTRIENEKKKVVSNASSTVDFKDVFDNIDLQYIATGSKLKENIIINKPTDKTEFIFNVNANNLIPKLQKDNSIIFYDTKQADKVVFSMSTPFMYDAKGAESNLIKVDLKQDKSNYILTLSPNQEWIKSSERVYPITIDPPIETKQSEKSIKDTFVSSNNSSDQYLNPLIRVGKSSSLGTTITYIKFDLPELTSAEMITNAEINAYYLPGYSTTSGVQINAHKVQADWTSSGLTWTNKPAYNNKVEDYNIISGTSEGWRKWDITGIAKEWYSTGKNYGLMFKSNDENLGEIAFCSSDYSNVGIVPVVNLYYVNNSGLEDYWTYHSQPIGRGGTGYINDYNGNLIYVHDDLTMNGNRMSISIKHVYNSNDRSTDIGYGPGWRLNLSQRVIEKYISGIRYYEYIDEDGTRHYFSLQDGVWKDETSLGYTLTLNGDGTFTITDKKNNKLIFTASGYLWQIIDSNGNQQTLSYNGATLVSVTDGSGRVVRLNVLSNNYLIGITDPSGRTTSFNYNGVQLSRITYPDNNYSTYTYDSNNSMITAKNYDGYTITYNYYDTAPYRVKKAAESNGSTLGQELHISYGFNTTTFINFEGRKDTYQFNNSGNTISVKNDDGSAAYYKYDDISNVNKLTTSSKLQKTTVNYLRNHNLEYDSNWSFANDSTSEGSGEFSTTEKYFGQRSIKVSKANSNSRSYYQQSLTLERDKTYTYSGYIKTAGISNNNGQGAHLLVHYKNRAGTWLEAYSSYASGTNGWTRYEVTFTIPSDASSADVIVRTAIANETGTANFDNLQLEEGRIANRYNLIENADLLYGSGTPDNWIRDVELIGSDSLEPSSGQDFPKSLNKNVFKITGEAGKRKNIRQTIQVSGSKGDAFVVAGWAKAESVPINDERVFALCVGVNKTDGNTQWINVAFNEDSSNWQYISDRIITDGDYTSITYFALYYRNANTAYFDGMQLYKEEFGTSYQYDSKGNIVSTQNLASQNSKFDYNGTNDLITSTDPKGGQFKYEYDGKHNVTKATSAENIVYSFTYDSNGNAKTAKVGDSTLFINSSAEYTASGNYTKAVIDSSGNSIRYNYNEAKGNLDNTVDAKGNSLYYLYDDLDRLTNVYSIPTDSASTGGSTSQVNDKIEVFQLNGSAAGTKGTNPITSNALYTSDGAGKTVLNATDGSKLIYNLGLSKNSGTMAAWISTKSSNLTRYVLTTSGKNDQIIHMYIGSDNKLSLAVRNNATDWVTLITAPDIISANQWYFTGFKWELNGGTLYCTLYVNDKAYSASTSNFLDFSGGDTAVGSFLTGTDTLKGLIEQFIYTSKALSNAEALSIYQKGRGNYLNSTYNKNSYSYQNDRIKSITHNNFSYNFGYDLLGNNNVVSVGSQNLITNYYGERTSRLLESEYGNHQKVSNDYDNLDRVTAKKYNGSVRYNYGYDASGNIGYHEDLVNGINYRYIYDTANRLVKVNDSQGNSLAYEYDKNNNSSKVVDKINGKTYETSYSYDKDNRPLSISYNRVTINNIAFTYDLIGRLKTRAINTGSFFYGTSFDFKNGVNGSTTSQISRITNNDSAIDYTYDKNGNIETISQGGKSIKYYYNELNELIREDNEVLNKIITYAYDAGGNITTKTEYPYTPTGSLGLETKTYAYLYNDINNWKDKLMKFDGKDITYDNIGNPLTYNGYTYTWEEGRQLKSISKKDPTDSTKNIFSAEYKYNDSGIRTQQIVNGITTKYHLMGDNAAYEDNGTDKAYYTYDSAGNLVSMNLNGVEYYYIRNVQGDIIGLFDKTGVKVVSYNYDSWGKMTPSKSELDDTTDTNKNGITGSLRDTVGIKNPYRYRGYRYDTETGLYYLQSRYYNPEWGRFINADGILGKTGELLGHNLFTYCKNNPINNFDPNGFRMLSNSFEEVEVITAVVAVIVTAFVTTRKIIGNAFSSAGKAIARKVSSTTKNTISSIKEFANRSKNKLKPDNNARGDHSTFKRDPNTGDITNTRTWKQNPQNPTGFDDDGGYDGVGQPHTNPVTGEDLMPHVHDKNVPGGVRQPKDWEVPGN